jgi:hypothetical protein
MTDKTGWIEIEFPDLDAKLQARMQWDTNEEMCQAFVSQLPLETLMLHAMSSGEEMYAPTTVVGCFAADQRPLTRYERGSVTLMTDNYKTMDIYYGEISEPLPGPEPVAVVRTEDLDVLTTVGREVWYANYLTHEGVRVRVSQNPDGVR